MPGRGLWAAGAFSTRAITQAAAQELREQGIHVALLIVDAGIEPVDGVPEDQRDAFADPRQIAKAAFSSPSRDRAPRRTSSRSRRSATTGCPSQDADSALVSRA